MAATCIHLGKAEALIRELGDDTIRLSGEGDMKAFAAKLSEQDYIQSLNRSEGNSMHLGVDTGQRRVPEILTLAAASAFTVREVSVERPNLGDVFFSATGREIRE